MVTANREDLKMVEGTQLTFEDMMAHAKLQADMNPEEAARVKAEVDAANASMKIALDDRIGSNRSAVMNELEERGDALRDAFAQLTPQQKAYGKLVGKLLASNGNADIESAFSWFEVEFDMKLSFIERCLALFQAAESLDMTEQTYRGVRKIFTLMNKKE